MRGNERQYHKAVKSFTLTPHIRLCLFSGCLFILAVLLVFALINTAKVPFFYLPSESLELPLIVILFGAFVAGALFGLFALFGRLIHLRNENARLRAEVQKNARLTTQDITAPQPVNAAKK